MEELPTFTKWLTSFGHSPSTNDSNPKSNLLTPNRPFLETPLAVPDSSQDAGPAVADVPPKDDSVQAVDDSISARAGCCCWQTSKSTRRECALKFHLSLRKRKVVTNEAGVVTAVSNLQEEETMVAVGDVLDKEGCGCRCWPTFQICGRTKGTVVGTSDLQKKEGAVTDGLNLQKEEVATNGTDLVKKEEKVVTNASSKARIVTAASNLQEEETVVAVGDVLDKNGCTCRCWPTFQICGRRKGIVVGTSDLQKEEGAVTDSLNLGKEEVATNGPNLVKEEEVVVVVDPDLRKEEGSGCFCGRWGCLPAFQICRRRKVVAVKEEVIVDVPKVEELTNDNVNMKEGDSVGSLQGRKSVDDNPQTFEKEAVASDYSSNVGVPNLQKEGSGCCSCFKCLPTFHICGRRRNVDSDVPNPSREEKVVVSGVSDLLEEKVVATDKESHSKPAQGGICWPFQICARGWLPRFFLCGEKTVVEASNHREEGEKMPLDVPKEEVVAVIPDPQKKNIAVADGIPDHSKEKQVVADDIPVLSTEEKMFVGKEKNVSSDSIQEVWKEEEIVDSGVDLGEKEEGGCCRCFKFGGGKEGDRRQHRRSSRSREGGWGFQIWGRGWLPTLGICGGRKMVSASIQKLHEEGLVNSGVSEVHNEVVDAAGVTGVVAATDQSKSTRGCGCWQSKPRRRRAVAVDKGGGSGRRSKSKRRRGWLRRWGRKQREEKERKR